MLLPICVVTSWYRTRHKNGLVTVAPFLLHERKVFSVRKVLAFSKSQNMFRELNHLGFIKNIIKLINRTRFPAKRRDPRRGMILIALVCSLRPPLTSAPVPLSSALRTEQREPPR